jgi:hypothetical protein
MTKIKEVDKNAVHLIAAGDVMSRDIKYSICL